MRLVWCVHLFLFFWIRTCLVAYFCIWVIWEIPWSTPPSKRAARIPPANPSISLLYSLSLFSILLLFFICLTRFSSRMHCNRLSVGHTAHGCHFAKWCKIIISRTPAARTFLFTLICITCSLALNVVSRWWHMQECVMTPNMSQFFWRSS